MDRKMNARNFGLRTSNMERALITAYQMKSNGDNTKNNCKSALKDFAKHLKENGINDLRKVKHSHVLSYAQDLTERFENQELSASTAQNYLSKVNVAMENARLDQTCRVEGVREAGLPNRSGIATINQSVTNSDHQAAIKHLSPRLSVQLELQRTLGLRLKESCLIDAKQVLKNVQETGRIRIESGTKGGRCREYQTHSQHQMTALQNAASIQGNDYSLIPKELSWAQYQNQCYREIQKTNIRFHGERHHYANARYKALMGVKSPISSGIKHGKEHYQYIATQKNITPQGAKKLDNDVRLQIAQELGHGRVGITNNYLG